MTTSANLKKPAAQRELQDWHWADVLAALRKRGWSLRQIGKAEDYSDGNALGEVSRRPYPKAEAILARYLGVSHPMLIWPTRYDTNGQPNRRFGCAPMRGQRPIDKVTTPLTGRNPQKAGQHD
ncbi:transcriptional regulator [Pseudoxanthomonas sp. UTMC 1351]|uniref:transcriptional regulator n=1 Tax=Pseudoxanthomonas sp. UTMC 1351 TaxID=2695853 RepID=UPI0034CFBA53